VRPFRRGRFRAGRLRLTELRRNCREKFDIQTRRGFTVLIGYANAFP